MYMYRYCVGSNIVARAGDCTVESDNEVQFSPLPASAGGLCDTGENSGTCICMYSIYHVHVHVHVHVLVYIYRYATYMYTCTCTLYIIGASVSPHLWAQQPC